MGSLRWKLFCSYLLLSFIPLLFYANTTLKTMEETYTGDKLQDLLNYANRVSSRIANENCLSDPQKASAFFDGYLNDEYSASSNRVVVTDASGRVVNDSDRADLRWWSENFMLLHSPEILSALDKKSAWSIQPGGEYMNVAVSVSDRSGGVAGAVLVISSIRDKNALISSMQQKLILLTVLLSLIVLILVIFISQLIIEPMKNILSAVKKISGGHLNQRIRVYGRDEFSELGASFNDMAARLEKVDDARSEFVSNVSHELKTPLSSIKVLGESLLLQGDVPPDMYKEFLTDINSEVDRMTKIINDLLALVLLDRKEQNLTVTTFKLNNILDDILKRLKPLAAQKGIALSLSDAETVTLKGDEMKISLALSNVIENGIKYTGEGGSVTVTLDSDSQNAIITVKDTGIGISEANQLKVFNRFYRVDKTRDRDTGGTGLGLSITQKTVLLHDGSVRITSKENEGSTFVIKLPLGGKSAMREG